MISRMWKATATHDGAAMYAEHFRAHVLPSLQRLEGYHGAMLLQRVAGQRVEVLVISFWRSEDAIRRFAGSDIDRAVVAADARLALESFDDVVNHFAVVEHDGLNLSM
jgi:heme-degrading monooxygenase HmoA